jgi:hypothetical protein
MTALPASLRRLVIERAGGCCEYCRIPQEGSGFPFEIDHIRSIKLGGKDDGENLALSCPICNARKGSNVAAYDPETDLLAPIFNPRLHTWKEHFELQGSTIQPLTAEGRVTVLILRMNDELRVERRNVLLELGRHPCVPPENPSS